MCGHRPPRTSSAASQHLDSVPGRVGLVVGCRGGTVRPHHCLRLPNPGGEDRGHTHGPRTGSPGSPRGGPVVAGTEWTPIWQTYTRGDLLGPGVLLTSNTL